jgi:hypothetical protein
MWERSRLQGPRFEPSTGKLAAIAPVAKGLNAPWVQTDPPAFIRNVLAIRTFVQGRPIAKRIRLMPLLDPPIARQAMNATPLPQR